MLFDLKKALKDEAKRLAAYAMGNAASKGRLFEERVPENRLPFQKDRDRVIHCKAFRRLNEKTQVFTAGTGDHYRTRLTHSLEVAQVSRDICRLLNLNEDLGETIALAHDLGHTAFGHSGQDVLNEIMEEFDLHFEHNEQSKRIVEKLEKLYPEFDGLNLTVEVLDGLIKHQTPWDQPLLEYESSPHLEAQVVNLADEIAYTCHDIDDGIRASIINLDQLRGLKLWDRALELTEKKHGKIDDEEILRFRAVSSLLSFLIMDTAQQSMENLSSNSIKYLEDVRKFRGMLIGFSDRTKVELSELRGFLYKNFYLSKEVIAQFKKAREVMRAVFDYYLKHSGNLPQKYSIHIEKGEKVEVLVKDYLAGMTDGFLMEEFERISNL